VQLQAELEATRGRALVEESREIVVVLDEEDIVLASSRRARESLESLVEGETVPPSILSGESGLSPMVIPYEVGGRSERLVYLSAPGDLVAYQELRAGFTAAVSHELRTPLARLMSLLETALLQGEDTAALVDQARAEVEQIRELIDDVLFLSELETGRAVVSLNPTAVVPVLRQAIEELHESADRAAVELRVEGDPSIELALRPRMLRMVAHNLAENSIRYAGPGSSFTISVERAADTVVLSARDDGAGVVEWDLPRLFERFYRADRARASRGTGLGLAIVKHVVNSAGGTVEARTGPGGGLEIACVFPA
jgi:two-component system, OmpR family, phosphate regulon sensor histidine kinase PhoR